eukprot:1258467-Rhodomonas_salina.1
MAGVVGDDEEEEVGCEEEEEEEEGCAGAEVEGGLTALEEEGAPSPVTGVLVEGSAAEVEVRALVVEEGDEAAVGMGVRVMASVEEEEGALVETAAGELVGCRMFVDAEEEEEEEEAVRRAVLVGSGVVAMVVVV